MKVEASQGTKKYEMRAFGKRQENKIKNTE